MTRACLWRCAGEFGDLDTLLAELGTMLKDERDVETAVVTALLKSFIPEYLLHPEWLTELPPKLRKWVKTCRAKGSGGG